MTETPTTAAVLAGLDDLRPQLADLYRDLHAHPELGLSEHRTAGRVADLLRAEGFDVTEGMGGTGVVAVLRRGDGPTVMLRADMDALAVEEATGLPYASRATAAIDGRDTPVMHACGHDMHVASLVGCATLMARDAESWRGTLIALFQPSEENGDGAQAMVDDGLVDRFPRPDVVLAQHVLPYPAGYIGTRTGQFLSAADSFRITLFGRGGHGSMPQATVDPVVLAASCVMKLQTIVSRELAPTTPAVVTVGSIAAGTGPNVIPDTAELEVNVRTYDDAARSTVLAAMKRIVEGESAAAGSPKPPEFEHLTEFPPTVNDAEPTATVAAAFADHFGDDAHTIDLQTASEDMSDIPNAFAAPYTYWGFGGIDPDLWAAAEAKGTMAVDVPVNHSPGFAPVIEPTLTIGTSALVVAALAWLADG